jgi:hypothetical protein
MKTNEIDDRGLLWRQTRQQAETKGRRSEALAAQWLSDLGYQILGQCLRTSVQQFSF